MSAGNLSSNINGPLGKIIPVEREFLHQKTHKADSNSAARYLEEMDKGLFGWQSKRGAAKDIKNRQISQNLSEQRLNSDYLSLIALECREKEFAEKYDIRLSKKLMKDLIVGENEGWCILSDLKDAYHRTKESLNNEADLLLGMIKTRGGEPLIWITGIGKIRKDGKNKYEFRPSEIHVFKVSELKSPINKLPNYYITTIKDKVDVELCNFRCKVLIYIKKIGGLEGRIVRKIIKSAEKAGLSSAYVESFVQKSLRPG